MRRVRFVAVAAAGVLLSGCAGPEPGLVGPQFSVTDLYLQPGQPSSLPPASAGTVTLSFGDASLTGTTGCAPLQGVTTLDGDRLHIDALTADPDGQCDPGQRRIHDVVVKMLAPGTDFRVSNRGPGEFVLTSNDGALDAPSMRLVRM
ncbi:META domain-containing protein [Corynebacterium uterequi]|uniref:Uncharacterized protein n=1 Tax=Corynebacterium uterequi TaxID=1072256 RepID=A0A0G3HEQ5_9CORY|nr:META domain-containing protein [Corynebacterium uterequi]AKK11836.1 hypothetical protein CUTER_09340 [Corynebacterium uterequi]